jgi:hypothetical protein
MADYYPLIARAVAGLDANATGETRRALYERARTALIAQLRGVEPALSEAEITRERLALEEAVRRVEAEAAQRPRHEASRSDPARGRLSEPPSREAVPRDPQAPRRGDSLREGARSAAARMAQNGPPPPLPQGERSRPRPPDHAPRPPRDPRQGRHESWDDVARARDSRAAPGHGGAPRPMPEEGRAPGGGTRGFRDVVADTNDLGQAAAQANRAARKTYASVPSPSPEFDRVEPDMEQRGGPSPYGHDEAFGAGVEAPEPDKKKRGRKADRAVGKRSGGFPLKSILTVGVVLILIGAGILVWQKAGPSIRAMLKPAPATNTQVTTDPATRPKITDRVGQPDSSTQPIAPVAQRAILYEEDPSDPQGKQTVGTVVWRLEQLPPSPKAKPDTAIRAEIDLPDRKMKVTLTLMRNTDPSMPATSHTIEVVFTVAPDFGTTIANVPGIYAKSPDQPRGTPLAATSVKVQDGYFLIGLSNVDVDRDRNIQVLKERTSLDIPMVYGNGKRAILSLEKGSPGERAFRDAFAAWRQ